MIAGKADPPRRQARAHDHEPIAAALMGRRAHNHGRRPHRVVGARPLARPIGALDEPGPPAAPRGEPSAPAIEGPSGAPSLPAALPEALRSSPSPAVAERPPNDWHAPVGLAVAVDRDDGGRSNGTTAPQLRRFIKSRPYVPLHELRRRFVIDGPDDDVTPIAVDGRALFVGLPEHEGRLLGELLCSGDIGYELSHDPVTPIVIGVFPMRPVPRP